MLLLRSRWRRWRWRRAWPASTIFHPLAHLCLQRVILGLLIVGQQSAYLVLRRLVDIHHLRALIRSGNRRVFAQRHHLLPRVILNRLHLSHLIGCQVQFLSQKLHLIPSHSPGPTTSMLRTRLTRWRWWWRRWILCP